MSHELSPIRQDRRTTTDRQSGPPIAILLFLFISTVLPLCCPLSLPGQVRNISYSLAPSGSYTWFNSRSGLDDAFQVGARLGMAFGQFVELRAVYLQTINQQIDLGFFEVDETLLDGSSVELARYGGELKLNLSRGRLLPFLTLGAGVQDVGRQGLEEASNIYASAGLGITLAASDRFGLSIEGKNTVYNYNTLRNLLNEAERTAQNLDLADANLERFGNWSVGAALQFYIGGRSPKTLSEVDLAYLNAFGNGFRGLRVPLELNLAKINFHEALPFGDTWLGGANLGVDIGPWIGLRAFYLRAMQDQKVSFDFDDLALYGGDLRLNLSRQGNGITPYLTLGGGYIDVRSDYEAADGARPDSRGFAAGGGGLILGLGKTVSLSGSAKALLTSTADIQDLSSTDQVRTSWMYTMGLNLALGNRADPQAAVQERVDQRLDVQQSASQARLDQLKKENSRQAQELKQRYESRIADLERQLNEAYANEDVDRAADILKEKEESDAILAEIEDREDRARRQNMMRDRARRDSIDAYFPDLRSRDWDRTGIVIMSPGQLTELVGKLEGDRSPVQVSSGSADRSNWTSELDRRIDRLEEMIRADRQDNAAQQQTTTPQQRQLEDRAELLKELKQIRQQQEELIRAERQDTTEQQQTTTPQQQQPEDSAELLKELKQIRQQQEELIRADRQDNAAQQQTTTPQQRQLEDRAELLKELKQIQEQQEALNERLNKVENGKEREVDRDREQQDQSMGARRSSVLPMDSILIQRGGDFLKLDTTGREPAAGSLLRYTGMSGFAGFNLGKDENATVNFGLRWHYDAGEKGIFQLMPEAFFGLGNPTNFGLSLNALAVMQNAQLGGFRPYVGTGFGVMQMAENDEDELDSATDFRPVFNLLFGTYMNVLGGRLYADFTARNLFNNNQLVVGYRFAF